MTYIRIPRPAYDKPGDKLWDKEYPRKRPDLDFQSIEPNEDDYFEPLPPPKTCEWTAQDEGPAHEIWKTGCGTVYERAQSVGWCNKCKKPIKFVK